MSKQIYLHGKYGSVIGNYAIVNDDKFEELNKYKWFSGMTKQTNTVHYYAVRNVNNRQQRMHRLIMGITNPKIEIDHINHNTLDNRIENLRFATKSQNGANQRKTRGKYPYKGVCQMGKHFFAHTVNMDKVVYIGMYATIEEAAQAYDLKMIELHGQYACLNFPDKDYTNVKVETVKNTNTGLKCICYLKRDDRYQVYKNVNKVRKTKHFKKLDEAITYLIELEIWAEEQKNVQ